MGLLSRSATFTIGDEPIVEAHAADYGNEDRDKRTSTPAEEAEPQPDPILTRELLLEARDRVRGRKTRGALGSESGASWSPPTLIAAGALVLTGLIAGTLGARLVHGHASAHSTSATHAESGRSRPHDRRVRPHRPHPRWRRHPAPTAAGTTGLVAARSSAKGPPIRPAATTRLPVSPAPNPTRPLPPAQPGGEFVLGGP